MLSVLFQVGRSEGQSYELHPLGNIVLTGNRRFDLLVRDGSTRVGELGLEYTGIRIPKMSLLGLLEHSIPSVVVLPITYS